MGFPNRWGKSVTQEKDKNNVVKFLKTKEANRKSEFSTNFKKKKMKKEKTEASRRNEKLVKMQ